MANLRELSKADIVKINQHYLNTLKSLVKTVSWIYETYGIQTNRHKLAQVFKKYGLTVLPPNGRSVGDSRARNAFSSGITQLAAKILQFAYDDYSKYIKSVEDGQPRGYINFLSACAFFANDFYPVVVNTVVSGASSEVSPDLLPAGIDSAVVRRGWESYDRQFRYWIGSKL